ncbi:hypothetical protein [uncultured Maritimibacter sp.]|jgi:hypothetical protein|uniref:hypothetical protein n=1 Tax=uncultured Maritimibacter sp. TaxID=991866 RepID=UPI000A6C6794|nr:hypothetical protein [uncultured Maritimibacter sp.]
MTDVNLPGLIVPIEARIDKLEKGLERASRAQRKTALDMENRAKQSADRIGNTYAKAGDVVAAAFKRLALPVMGAAGLAGIAKASLDAARGVAQIGDEAKRAGVSTKAFQEWKFVADQNRIAVDSLIDGLKELNLRADEFVVTGKGSAAEAFARLGYSAEELNEKLQDPSELMLDIIGRMKSLNTAARIRVADELFGGTAGERFVELIDQGEDGLRRTVDRAHELGLVLSDEVIAQADDVSRKFDELTQRLASFGKRAAVAVADGVAEIADLRAKLDGIFADETQGRAILGNELYDALEKNRDVVDAQVVDLGLLRKSYEELSDTVRMTTGQLVQSSNQARAWGYVEQSATMSEATEQMRALTDEFTNGTLTGEEFAEQLSEIQGRAAAAFNTMEESDKVEFSNVISQVSQLGAVIQTVLGLTSALNSALANTAGVELGKSEIQTFREADAESMRNWEIEKQNLSDFLAVEGERNAMSRERLSLENEIASVQKRAAADGVFLTRSQAEAAASAKIAADAARSSAGSSRGGGGGGGGSSDDFGDDVAAIQEETAALIAEANELNNLVLGFEKLSIAQDIARTKAELLQSAQASGRTITPALTAEIEQLANSYANAAQRAEDAQQRHEDFAKAVSDINGSLKDAFTGLVTGATTFTEALGNVLSKLAEIAASRLFEALWGGVGGDNLIGSVLSGLGLFSSGGYTGDGGKFQPAGVVHKGEFVFSKEATSRIGAANLSALHQTAQRGYANGGLVGSTMGLQSASGARSDAQASQAITINAPVTVNGSSGTPEQNRDLARQVTRELEGTMRGLVVDELRRQMRPGNILNTRG